MDDEPHSVGELIDAGLRTAASVLRRLAVFGLALIAFGLVLIGKVDTRIFDTARSTVSDLSAPVLDAVSSPFAGVYGWFKDVAAIGDLIDENRRLREENARLANLRLIAHDLKTENAGLRRLLRFDPGPVAKSVSTRIIADTGGVFARSLMVHVGGDQGVRKDLPVLAAEGLIGRVQTVGRQAARVLLITDLNSKIPVAIGESRRRAIMTGTNGPLPRLEFFVSDAAPAPGAIVLTSGDGGVFRAGLPIGVVEAAAGGGWEVRPFVDWDRLDFVRIVDYGSVPQLDLAQGSR
ncbi:MAG: rod shape-determining protein MreC [Alphaproteobacteria bacterium]|nr:rod shape-determining protein MreC [Alphaproteobacteria bacterium]MCB9929651.1 rod shape-determining protein MreC [Alphaproteobacteria bacterium]